MCNLRRQRDGGSAGGAGPPGGAQARLERIAAVKEGLQEPGSTIISLFRGADLAT